MAASMSAVANSRAPCTLPAARATRAQRPAPFTQAGAACAPLRRSSPAAGSRSLAGPSPRSSSALQAVPVAELAGEFAEISGYATVMFAITLVGLAAGFVLLRFEALVEEGKLDNLLK